MIGILQDYKEVFGKKYGNIVEVQGKRLKKYRNMAELPRKTFGKSVEIL